MSINFAANLGLLFPDDVSFAQRCERTKKAGFNYVELLFPYQEEPDFYGRVLADHGLKAIQLNTPVSSHKGLAAVKGREVQFKKEFQQALAVAQRLEARSIHVMAGCSADGELSRDTFMENMNFVLDEIKDSKIGIHLEALNQFDVPGYFYSNPLDILGIIREIGSQKLKIQLDFYHAKKNDLNILEIVENIKHKVGHLQIAGLKQRAEPEFESLEVAEALKLMVKSGYSGFLGCEYRPRDSFESGLSWVKNNLISEWVTF